jgi:hypothetical protein
MKHTKINTLLDSGYQAKLSSEEVVKQLGLKTKMHRIPYSLNWIRKNHKFPITKQCVIKFAITSKFLDELICDVVLLEACGMVLASSYLHDRKTIFFKEQNQYHLTKEKTKYVVHAHLIKGNQSLLTMEQLKKETYAINTPMIVPNEAVDLKQEIKMVVACRSSHTFLQVEFLSCK